MSGIYIHIPFCKRACHYCNFHFSTTLGSQASMIDCLVKEIETLSADFQETIQPVETIYFGGGTPSLLSFKELNIIMKAVYKNFKVSSTAEVTFEVNPDDVSDLKIEQWKNVGINRLSLGVQSFYEEDLQWMNRAHNAAQSIASIDLIKQHFNNFSIDLIYGTPGLSDIKWKSNVEKAIGLKIPHLSCYALTVEPATALYKMIEKKTVQDVNPEQQANQFLLLMQWLGDAGYEHYEISNFALPGYRSRHNSNYWSGNSYIGIGPSAHSFFGTVRRWNISNNALYMQSIKNNSIPYESEELDEIKQFNEYIMTALRTSEGVQLDILKSRFGNDKAADFLYKSQRYLVDRRMNKVGNALLLTNRGKLYADGISADLFV
ncbi:MAG: radical SAM family heme chaperone HemW [Ginsengibacter sp.]